MLILIFLFVSFTKQDLKLYNTQNLQEQIKILNGNDKLDIPFEIANFGSIPYGRRIIGDLQVADPFDACGNISQHSIFVLIDRGNCSFVTKVYNAQLQGNKVAIIMDNLERKTDIVMVDDGMGDRIVIPSIFIHYKYGDLLKNYILTNKSLQLVIEFEESKYEKSNYRFWISIPSITLNSLVHSFSKVRSKLSQSQTSFEPIYDIQQCIYCKNSNFDQERPDCILNGRFCANDPNTPDNEGNILGSGRDVVNETIRQLCIYKLDSEFWWEYFESFSIECIKPQLYSDCSTNLMKHQDKINLSEFEQCIQKNSKEDSPILARQISLQSKQRIRVWPTITINDFVYRGNLDGDDIVEAICASLVQPTGECIYVLDPNLVLEKSDQKNNTNFIFIMSSITVGFVGLFLVLAWIYKKIVNKEISSGTHEQVNQMVSQYIEFYEQKQNNEQIGEINQNQN